MSKRIFAVVLVLGLVGSGLAAAAPHIGNIESSAAQAQDPEPEASPTPPGHQDPPGKKKGCDKGSPKAKKNGCKKTKNGGVGRPPEVELGPDEPELQACSPYRPDELGAGAPTYKLTDANGHFSPIKINFVQPGGIKTGLPTDSETGGDRYFNVQVEPSTPQTGLWARLEFEERRDYDLILFDRNGNEVASSRGFNVAYEEVPLPSESKGGESTNTSETLTGIRSDRCAGYTLNVSSAAAEGGELRLKLWLGPIRYTPSSFKR